ncbi:MAG: glycosyltransferase family protein [Acidobacteria bacterium]|nr:glycosyltransferase family protein [Acidobacteriota bacterium]
MLIFVTATRKSQSEFDKGPLGQSLLRIAFDKSLCLSVSTENRSGLPVVYNRVISEQYREHQAVFLHDDIWLDDIFVAARIRAGLENFDIIGLAGNRVLHPDAPAWHVKDDTTQWDSENLSGLVCHGANPFGLPALYGSIPARVQLLDGVLIAARISSLLDAGVRFDERFDFHFYDLDFSRQANAAGLTVGTWPISITHASGGAFGSDGWKRGLELYRSKWQNAVREAGAEHATNP